MSQPHISFTAWVVMSAQLVLKRSKRWHSLVGDSDAPFYRHCADYCNRQSLFFACLSRLSDSIKFFILDSLLAKGAVAHFGLRKQAISRQAYECAGEGITQIVIIGAGFDALAYNVANAYKNIVCFEIDAPVMSGHKSAILQSLHVPPNLHCIAADLSVTPLHDALAAQPAFNAGHATLFIAEGLTMYLAADDVKRLLHDMRSLGQDMRLLFTAIEKHKHGVNKILALRNESFRWSMLHKNMSAFLSGKGFTQRYLRTYADLQRPWRNDKEMKNIERQNGEYLVYAVANYTQ